MTYHGRKVYADTRKPGKDSNVVPGRGYHAKALLKYSKVSHFPSTARRNFHAFFSQ